MPGWLGASSPEGFVDCINQDDVLPCHQTIDYADPHWKDKWIAQSIGNACAGALVMAANMCKMPRDRDFPKMPRDAKTVFANPLDFVRHHRGNLAQSWNDDDQSDEAKYLRVLFERQAKKTGQPIRKSRQRKAGAR
jgi:hypothetical protein